MPIARTAFQFFWRDCSIPEGFLTGVSLHSHTMYSEENLEMISLRRTMASLRAVWTPPLSPQQAYSVEERQIQRQFELPGLVSLTDHDDIRAGTLLHSLQAFRHAPISTEWTVPFGRAFFHLGIHNLPAAHADDIMQQLRAFTAQPHLQKLDEILDGLDSHPDTLVVLNHPLWDEEKIGQANHADALAELLNRYGRWFHALEVNGFRPWRENQDIITLGQQWELPIISGGDRHGCEPNAILNLSRARSIEEFIHEVRRERVSHVVFMPQYRESLGWRIFQTVLDVIRGQPETSKDWRDLPNRTFDPVRSWPFRLLAKLTPRAI
ncbi:MAG: hypothetical protein JO097_02740 [Acidobacteriaceae bacterium]|nr:hypothetical protein [Acidobacteriaceae bacterium]MBV9764260.1 hypothetical protein [Acidobacteriaceae bacterium]